MSGWLGNMFTSLSNMLTWIHVLSSGDYWITVAQDYKEVAVDTVVESRKHPLKTSVYLSCKLLRSIYLSCWHIFLRTTLNGLPQQMSFHLFLFFVPFLHAPILSISSPISLIYWSTLSSHFTGGRPLAAISSSFAPYSENTFQFKNASSHHQTDLTCAVFISNEIFSVGVS